MKKKYLTVMTVVSMIIYLLAVSTAAFAADEIITVGSGSYSKTWPNVPMHADAFNPPAMMLEGDSVWRTANVTGPTPTSDWWSSLVWERYSHPMFADPLAVQAVTGGLKVHRPAKEFKRESVLLTEPIILRSLPTQSAADILVRNSGVNVSSAKLDGYSDWSVDILMGDEGGKNMVATVSHGSPYVYFTLNNCSAGDRPQLDLAMAPVVFYDGNDYLGITLDGKHYGIYAPAGSDFTITSGSNRIEIVQGALHGYFSIASLPDDSVDTLQFYRTFAYSFLDSATAEPTYDKNASTVVTDFTVSLDIKQAVDGTMVNETLLALYPHQWRFNDSIKSALTGYSYDVINGEMKVIRATSFSTTHVYQGILPFMPLPEAFSGYSQSELRTLVLTESNKSDADLIGPLLEPGRKAKSSYSSGKDMNRLVQLAAVAYQIGEDAAGDRFMDLMTGILENWVSTDSSEIHLPNDYGKNEPMLYYDDLFGSFVAAPTGYYADALLCDHHFHYGYWIYAAAQRVMRDKRNNDSTWLNNYKDIITLVLKDYANYERDSDMFPYLRNFDPYAGHSWANGGAKMDDGNDQESSSEAINAYAAMILWGEAIGDSEITEYGVYMYTTEVEAVKNYWFDIYGDVFDDEWDREEACMVWGSKRVNVTWFGAGPSGIHGINFLPITAASLYLGHDADYIRRNVNAIETEEDLWRDAGILSGGALGKFWPDVNGAALALGYADEGYNWWKDRGAVKQGGYKPEYGMSDAFTYHWMYSLKTYGQVDLTARATNHTLYAVFHSGATRNYVVYNNESTAKEVIFSDGFSFTVPAGQMMVESQTISPLDPPANVVKTADDSLIFVSWDKVDGATGYRIRYNGLTKDVDAHTTSSYIDGLSNGTSYYVSVAALNYAGEGTYSAETQVVPAARTQAPAPVVLKTVVPEQFQTSIRWERSEGASWYLVKYGTRSGDYSATINAGYTDNCTYTISGLDNGTFYFVSVVAVNSAGQSALSNEKAVVPGVSSSYEKGIIETGSSEAEIYLIAPRGVEVLLFGPTGTIQDLDSDGDKKFEFPLTGLTKGQLITFHFLVINMVNGSKTGDVVEEKLSYNYVFNGEDSKPEAPSNLTVSNITETSMDLAWNASATAGVTYNVYKNGGLVQSGLTATSYTAINLSAWTDYTFTVKAEKSGKESNQADPVTRKTADTTAPTVPDGLQVTSVTYDSIGLSWNASTDNGQVARYIVYLDGSPVNSSVSGTSYTFTDLESNRTYTMNVEAVDGAGLVSGLSAEKVQKTPVNIAPATNVQPYAVGAHFITIVWNASVSQDVAYYEVYQDGVLAQSNLTGQTHTALNLESGKTYRYYVIACVDADNKSVESNEITVTTPDIFSPTKPRNVRVTAATSNSLDIAWDAAEDNVEIAGYTVYVDDVENATASVGGTVTSTTITGLEADREYKIEVEAYDGANLRSGKSTPVYGTTEPQSGYTQNATLPNGLQLSYTTTANFDGTNVIVTFESEPGITWVLLIASGGYQMSQISDTKWQYELGGYSAGQIINWYFVANKNGANGDNSTAQHSWEIGGQVTPTVETPSITPAGGAYDFPLEVTISCATSGAQIRYTTDGSEPTETSAVYSSVFTLTDAATVKAKAFKSGMNDSAAAAEVYTKKGPTPEGYTLTKAANGDVEVTVTFDETKDMVQLFMRRNGEQFLVPTITGNMSDNGNGTYTYSYTAASSYFSAGQNIDVRFYSAKNGVQEFTPGPLATDWSDVLAY